jgi:hypothetical protein
MTLDELEALIHSDVAVRFQAYRDSVRPEPPDGGTEVPAGGDLQAALDQGGAIGLAAGATYSGNFRVTQSDTTLAGRGAQLVGQGGAALRIPPGVSRVRVTDLVARTTNYSSVVAVGDNTLTDASQVPTDIRLTGVVVPSHRGRRGFELHAADVRLIHCTARDIWDPALGDSQGVWINNGPGPYLVSGGYYEAASENLMVGGSTCGIAGLIPADITIEDLTLAKPLAWQSDGIKRAVKNLLELKTGTRVRVQRVRLSGCWADAQPGYAIVITPRNAGAVTEVVFDAVHLTEAGAAFNISGHDDAGKPPTPELTRDVVVQRSTFQVSAATYGGRGSLAQLLHGVASLTFEDVTFTGDGTAFILGGDAEPLGSIGMTASYAVVQKYGFKLATNGTVAETVFSGNTFSEPYPAAFPGSYPENTYVDRATFDALIADRLPPPLPPA